MSVNLRLNVHINILCKESWLHFLCLVFETKTTFGTLKVKAISQRLERQITN